MNYATGTEAANASLVNTGISYSLLFRAMRSLNGAVKQIAGYDEWRHPTEETRLRDASPLLAREIPFAPSKRIGNPNSVWSKVHFHLMLSGLRNLPQHPLWGKLQEKRISAAQTRHYFKFVDDVLEHLTCYEQAHECSLALHKNIDNHDGGMVQLLATYAEKHAASHFGQFLKGMAAYIHTDNDIAIHEWQESGKAPSLVSGLLRLLLPLFPAGVKELSVEHKRLLGAADRNNNLLGRIIQSFYADERGVSYAQMGIHALARDYFRQSLHNRLLHYMDELAHCPLAIRSLADKDTVPLADILMLYCSWYQKPQVVEMISPDFSGAGEDASLRLEEIFTSLAVQEGLQPLSFLWLPEPVQNGLAQDEQLCLRLGWLVSVMDSVGNKPNTQHPISGTALYELGACLWQEDTRNHLWGSSSKYLIGHHQASFEMMEEVITQLQALRCNFNDHRLMLGADYADAHIALLAKHIDYLCVKPETDLSAYLREHYKDFISIRNVAQKVAVMDKNSPASADAISYILHYFRIEYAEPIALPLSKFFARVPVLQVDAVKRTFRAVYHEHGETVEIAFSIPEGHEAADVRYITQPFTEEGLTYPSHFLVRLQGKAVVLPVPARQGYDPMGVTGTPHHAEVIGFGCAYHHHVLQSLLVCMAAWGADDATLREAQAKMMAIHPRHHHRKPLAEWQLEQTFAAFRHGRRLTYAQWIKAGIKNGKLHLSYGHNHTATYLHYVESSIKNHFGKQLLPKEYSIRMAWLHAVYPEFYPTEHNKALLVDADAAWYEAPPAISHAFSCEPPSPELSKIFA